MGQNSYLSYSPLILKCAYYLKICLYFSPVFWFHHHSYFKPFLEAQQDSNTHKQTVEIINARERRLNQSPEITWKAMKPQSFPIVGF